MADILKNACKLGLVIAVSGLPGSGKSTLAKRLASNLGLRYVSSGMLFRNMAKEKGMSLEEFTMLAEKDHSVDRAIDSRAVAEAMRGCVVLDGHIAAWVAKQYSHLTIYLQAPEEVRATRIASRDGKDIGEALKEVRLRDTSEAKRFREIYGIDVKDLEHLDLVINTAKFDAEVTYRIALEAVTHIMESLIKCEKSLKTATSEKR